MKMTLRTEHTLVDEQGRPVEPGARVRDIETGLLGTISSMEETPGNCEANFHIDMGSERPLDLTATEVVRRLSLQEPEVEPKSSAELDDILDHLEGGETITKERDIIFALLPLAGLPNSVENLVKDAVHKDGLELCPATVAALDKITLLRDPDRKIPF